MKDPPFVKDLLGHYSTTHPAEPDHIIDLALSILADRVTGREIFTKPSDTRNFLTCRLAREESEVFCALFLDNRHRLIAFETLFYGTIDGASVHPREVVKKALFHNAAALIFAHNHPSGVAEPSSADRSLTRRLQEACTLVDVRVLDHIVVGGPA